MFLCLRVGNDLGTQPFRFQFTAPLQCSQDGASLSSTGEECRACARSVACPVDGQCCLCYVMITEPRAAIRAVSITHEGNRKSCFIEFEELLESPHLFDSINEGFKANRL